MERACDRCGKPYEAKRANSRFCSGSCRATAHNSGMSKPANPKPAPKLPEGVSVKTAALAELTKADRVDSAMGQLALQLAGMIDLPDFGSQGAIAGWSREFRAAMADALKDAKPAKVTKTALELARERRDAKRA